MKEKKIIFNHIITYPTPYNISYFYSFGFLSGFMLMNQIITGLILAMFYINSGEYTFDSIEYIMRNVNYGWFIRYLHSNGASFFFIILYLHIAKGLYYKSYMYPRQYVWFSGLIMYFLIMATAFLGYVLPWGQMSFWGATVITNLISVIPLVGTEIVEWIWSGYSVNSKTLQRFFVLHYLLPFIILALVMLHLSFLHKVGSSNPLNFDKKNEKIDFFPYFFIKDIFLLIILFVFLIIIVCFYSNLFNHADNYIKANSLSTPHHIVPEWYFLPFYAILRAIANKTFGIILFVISLIVFFILPFINIDQYSFYLNLKNKYILSNLLNSTLKQDLYNYQIFIINLTNLQFKILNLYLEMNLKIKILKYIPIKLIKYCDNNLNKIVNILRCNLHESLNAFISLFYENIQDWNTKLRVYQIYIYVLFVFSLMFRKIVNFIFYLASLIPFIYYNILKKNLQITYLISIIKFIEIFINLYLSLSINKIKSFLFIYFSFYLNKRIYNKNLYNIWFYTNNLYYYQLFWLFVVVFISLGYVGQMEVNTVSIELGQDLSLLYFLILFLFGFPYKLSIVFIYIILIYMYISGVFFSGFFSNLEQNFDSLDLVLTNILTFSF